MVKIAIANHNGLSRDQIFWNKNGFARLGNNIGNGIISKGLLNLVNTADYPNYVEAVTNLKNPVESAKKISNEYDAVFMILQDHVMFQDFNYDFSVNDQSLNRLILFLENLSVPVLIHSLTSRAMSVSDMVEDKLTKFSSDLLDLLKNENWMILTRGRVTSDFLNDYGIRNARPVCCPSIFAYEPLEIKPAGYSNVITTGWCQVTKFPSTHIIQGDGIESKYRQLATLKSGYHGKSKNFLKREPNYGSLTAALSTRKAYFPSSFSNWREILTRSSLTVGSRLHGSILSLLAGTSSICVADDIRSTETYSALGISSFKAIDITNENVENYSSFDFNFKEIVLDKKNEYQNCIKDFLA
jgi:hypothetical protein